MSLTFSTYFLLIFLKLCVESNNDKLLGIDRVLY